MNGTVILRVAFRALYRNKGRSLLTALGIIIGIAAVIVVVALGEGASTLMKKQIGNLGDNIMMIFPGSMQSHGVRDSAGSQPTLTVEDGESLLKECRYVTAFSPALRGGGKVVYRDKNWSTGIPGVGLSYLEVRNWQVEKGDFFTESDIKSATRVCVLGQTVARQLFEDEDPVGKNIRIRNMPFRVLGVLSRKGSAAWGQDLDDTVCIPWTTSRRVLQKSSFRNVDQLLLSITSMEDYAQAKEEITAILRQRHHLAPDAADDFTVNDLTEITQIVTQVSGLMTILLTVIASISLIVGGIGIMNIMLAAVSERTREIGLRMAVGAKRRDILLQFLAEAVALAGVGGVIGIILGIGATYTVSIANNWPVLISPVAILIAFSFSAGVGVFFGFYPAWRAARMDPIESLRRE